MRKIKVFTLFVGLFLMMAVVACAATQQKNKAKVIGEWLSTSIKHNDPFFKKNPNFDGMIKITFTENEIEWVWYKLKERKDIDIEAYFKGPYIIKNNELSFASKSEDEFIGNYTVESNKLTITTNDGFLFKLKKIK